MNTYINTGSDRRTVILYMSSVGVCFLLIFDGSSMKFITGENTSLKVLQMCSSCAPHRSLCGLDCPFIADLRGSANWPSARHKCGVLIYTTTLVLC
jgi:hypothetical protein